MDVSGYLKLGGHIVMRRTTAIWRRLPKMGKQLPTRHLRPCATCRGIGIQFSTSNNTTSLYDHWLVVCLSVADPHQYCSSRAQKQKWETLLKNVEVFPGSGRNASLLFIISISLISMEEKVEPSRHL